MENGTLFTSKFYRHVAEILLEKSNGPDFILNQYTANNVLSKFNIPRYLRYSFLKELEELGYIKILNKQKIKLIKTNIGKNNILEQYENGKKQFQLEEEVGINQGNISKLINHKKQAESKSNWFT